MRKTTAVKVNTRVYCCFVIGIIFDVLIIEQNHKLKIIILSDQSQSTIFAVFGSYSVEWLVRLCMVAGMTARRPFA